MLKSIWLALATVAVIAASGQTRAGFVTVSNFDTADIVVPVFDTSLGTLNSVELSITFRGGQTSVGGAHSHGGYTLLSTNGRSNALVSGFDPFTVSVGGGGAHNHTFASPNYAGGGITIGGFNGFTSFGGNHGHTATVTDGGLQLAGGVWRQRANVSFSTASGHAASFGSQTKNLSFSGGDLIAFQGGSDIHIGAGAFATNAAGNHTHSVASFGIQVSSSTGSWTWNFAGSTTPSSGLHSLILDPRFDTVARFNYTEAAVAAVPEPGTLALVGMGGIGMFGGWYRKRRKTTVAA